MSTPSPSTIPTGQLAGIEAQAVEIVREAGRLLLARFRTTLKVDWKGKKEGVDPVTEADREVEEFVRGELERRFPDHGIAGEEGAGSGSEARPYTWVLDPLDGTVNFMNGLPLWACSLGLIENGVPVVGAILIPWPRDGGVLVASAYKGGGARLDGEEIRLPSEERSPARIAVMPFGAFRLRRQAPSQEGRPVERRSVGSIAYELAATAMGIYRYVIFTGPRTWDVAAGIVIVQEAGGKVYTMDSGARWRPFERFSAQPDAQGKPAAYPGQEDLRRRIPPVLAGPALDVEDAVQELVLAPSLLSRLLRTARRALMGAGRGRPPPQAS
ncbi:MAG TPA: inositol monophosphatase [Dehalococcoidia bacterium]|nr:inositol monophosphatase [Dehalococcoidia bacterium]